MSKVKWKSVTPGSVMSKKHETDAGWDLSIQETVTLFPGEAVMAGTGVSVEIPEGFVGLLFLRSSVGRAGVQLANTVGVIDSDYRGEVKLALTGRNAVTLSAKERVAQLVVVPCMLKAEQVEELSITERGTGGFGSTGK